MARFWSYVYIYVCNIYRVWGNQGIGIVYYVLHVYNIMDSALTGIYIRRLGLRVQVVVCQRKGCLKRN